MKRRQLFGRWCAQLAAVSLLLVVGSNAPAQQPVASTAGAAHPTDRHGFDFLVGEWRVRHRRTNPATGKWVEFDGTCSGRFLLDGSLTAEEHLLNSPSGAYRALGLHAYDAKTGKWSNWWLDGRYPQGPLDPPVQGQFENGVAATYSEFDQDGKKVIARLKWSDVTATSFRFEQATSDDAGKTWETNWIMEFQRVDAPQVQ
jgi:hypothetical protein